MKQRVHAKLTPERAEELILVAEAVFIEKGLGNATIDLIAQRAAMSKSTIYRRFKNKFELFEAVVFRASTRAKLAAEALIFDYNEPKHTLRTAAVNLGDITEANKEIVRLLVAEAGRLPDLARAYVNGLGVYYRQSLTDYFEGLIALGRMQKINPEDAAQTFIHTFSHALKSLFNALESKQEERRILEANLEMFLRGNSIKT